MEQRRVRDIGKELDEWRRKHNHITAIRTAATLARICEELKQYDKHTGTVHSAAGPSTLPETTASQHTQELQRQLFEAQQEAASLREDLRICREHKGKEKEDDKTGSVPRTPGTPFDARQKPKRIQEVIGQLQFFCYNPAALREGNDGEVTQFLQAHIDCLQEITKEEESADRKVPREWDQTRDIAVVARALTWFANQVSVLKGIPAQRLAHTLSAWGATLLQWTDDGKLPTKYNGLLEDGGANTNDSLVKNAQRLGQFALKRPGRSLRLLVTLSDDLRDWLTAEENDSPLESERELRAQLSRERLSLSYQDFLAKTSVPRPRALSPFPEFDERWEVPLVEKQASELSGDAELTPRPNSPEPGQLIQRLGEAPVVTLRQPTFPTPEESRSHTPDTELVITQEALPRAGTKRAGSPLPIQEEPAKAALTQKDLEEEGRGPPALSGTRWKPPTAWLAQQSRQKAQNPLQYVGTQPVPVPGPPTGIAPGGVPSWPKDGQALGDQTYQPGPTPGTVFPAPPPVERPRPSEQGKFWTPEGVASQAASGTLFVGLPPEPKNQPPPWHPSQQPPK